MVTVRTIGAAGTIIVSGDVMNPGITGISSITNSVTVNAVTTGVNTTAAGFLTVSYKSAATTTTCTFQQVVIEQVKD